MLLRLWRLWLLLVLLWIFNVHADNDVVAAVGVDVAVVIRPSPNLLSHGKLTGWTDWADWTD